MKQQLTLFRLLALASTCTTLVLAADAAKTSDALPASAIVIHRADVIKNRDETSSGPMRLWPLLSTPEARMNYIEVTGKSGAHFHPDADHRLYVLEGKVIVITGKNSTTASVGDMIVIPKGVPHWYDVPAKGDRALLLTFDAPPYDPKKTVPVTTSASK